jgi:putative oxidoreductase
MVAHWINLGDTMNSAFFAKWQPYVLSLLRFYVGLSIIEHGLAKILDFPHVQQFGNPAMGTLAWTGGMIELIGGALMIVGLFTRPAAFILSGFTAVAYFMVHAPRGFFPVLNGGELAAVYCFVFLYLVFAGGGPISLDALLRKKD